jgi:hypothetical protein
MMPVEINGDGDEMILDLDKIPAGIPIIPTCGNRVRAGRAAGWSLLLMALRMRLFGHVVKDFIRFALDFSNCAS